MCGATTGKIVGMVVKLGLSPRVWGNRRCGRRLMVCVGSIPTCVGQPEQRQKTNHPTPVYPHVCGATFSSSGICCREGGLSPRVWGNLRYPAFYPRWQGSIPTCVGQPIVHATILLAAEVYPHVCGATNVIVSATPHSVGLSPRVWGNLSSSCRRCRYLGSIPTCVGQPLNVPHPADTGKVYPHVCGATRV